MTAPRFHTGGLVKPTSKGSIPLVTGGCCHSLPPGRSLESIAPSPGSVVTVTNIRADGQVSEFANSLLRSIAASFGTSYEQLSRDYEDAERSAEMQSSRDFWRRYFEFHRERDRAVRQMFEPFFRRLALPFNIQALVGHDPQRLLPAPSETRL